MTVDDLKLFNNKQLFALKTLRLNVLDSIDFGRHGHGPNDALAKCEEFLTIQQSVLGIGHKATCETLKVLERITDEMKDAIGDAGAGGPNTTKGRLLEKSRLRKEEAEAKLAAMEAAKVAAAKAARLPSTTTEDDLDALMAEFGFEEGDDCSGEKGETKKKKKKPKKKK
jgi:hypothetical protein